MAQIYNHANMLKKLAPMRRIKKIHFVGIGGSGMNGLAQVLLNQGYQISGSDLEINQVTKRLQGLGAEIFIGHAAENVKNADVVVISSAIKQDNIEVLTAAQALIPVISRAELLAELMRFRYGIAIAGTHGKTTTTSLVASLFEVGQLNPTYIIGGKLNSAGSYARLGSGQYLIAEADESDSSFLQLQPMVSVVTNIDRDHMTNYDDNFELVQQTYLDFLHHLPFYGLAVLCIDDVVVRSLLPKVKRPILTYGFSKDADIVATKFKQVGTMANFDVQIKEQKPFPVQLALPGRHNALNALAAIAIAVEEGIDIEDISRGLKEFSGIGRRFQIYPEIKINQQLCTIVDDYGHHPTEIKPTLEAIREAWPDRRLVHVFQPHRYTRTADLLDEFANVCSQVDELILLDVYPAGEKPNDGADSQTLALKIKNKQQVNPIRAQLVNLTEILESTIKANDIILMQGAGDIGAFVYDYVKQNRQQNIAIDR